MVSGRTVAALGPVDLLARRRANAVARPRTVRRRARAHALHERRRAPLHHRAGPQAGPDRALRRARLRRRLLLPLARTPPARQRRPLRVEARRRAGARAPAPRVHAEARRRHWLHAAHRARQRRRRRPRARRSGLEDGPLVPARRPALSHSGRFAHGLPPAARLATVGQQGRLPLHDRARSDRAARHAAQRRRIHRALCGHVGRAGQRRPRRRALRLRHAARRGGHGAHAGAGLGHRHGPREARPERLGARHPRHAPAAPRRVGPLGHAHRAVRRSARPAPRQRPVSREKGQRLGRALCVHAAAQAPRRLSRPRRRRRSHGARPRREDRHGRLSAAARSASEDAGRHTPTRA